MPDINVEVIQKEADVVTLAVTLPRDDFDKLREAATQQEDTVEQYIINGFEEALDQL